MPNSKIYEGVLSFIGSNEKSIYIFPQLPCSLSSFLLSYPIRVSFFFSSSDSYHINSLLHIRIHWKLPPTSVLTIRYTLKAVGDQWDCKSQVSINTELWQVRKRLTHSFLFFSIMFMLSQD